MNLFWFSSKFNPFSSYEKRLHLSQLKLCWNVNVMGIHLFSVMLPFMVRGKFFVYKARTKMFMYVHV